MTLTLRSTKGSPLTHAEMDANWSHLENSDNQDFVQAGTGATTRSVQDKLRDWVSVKDFGAVGDGTTNDAAAIQRAVTALGTLGGVVYFPRPSVSYSVGTTGITGADNVCFKGESYTVGAAGGGGDGGTIIKYTGTGDAIRGNGVKAFVIEDLIIDGSGTTGSSAVGIALRGAWGCTLQRVSVTGITPSKGYGMLVRTIKADSSAYGAQHNYFECCECADGILRFAGTSSGDRVTTQVVNNMRGAQYEVDYADVIFINATAEKNGTMTNGYAFTNNGDSLMLGCDIEGAFTNGISIDSTHKVRDGGSTIWSGFSGTTRVSGNMADWTLYGSGIDLRDDAVTAGALINGDIAFNDKNAYYAFIRARANNVTGGAQDGHIEISRRIAGTEIKQATYRNYLRIEHSKSIANSATTVLTIPIATNKGIRVKVHAEGIQTGAGTMSVYRDCVAINDAGTVTHTDGTELEVDGGGAAGAITFTASTTNLLVQFNHASATPTTINFVIEINGPIASYTLG